MKLLLPYNIQAILEMTAGETRACVLLIHGWTGQMDEVGGLFKRLAKQLSNQGIASLRLNIRGESEQSESKYELTSTFSSRLEDAKAGLGFIQSTYSNIPIGIVGFSLGGATAMALAGKYPHSLDSVVLWSSAGNPNELANTLFDEALRNEVEANGFAMIDKSDTFIITRKHLDGFKVDNVLEQFAKYRGALLCVRGTEDYLPDIDKIIMNLVSSPHKKSISIADADHIFNVLEPDTHHDENLLNETVKWLKQTLK